MSEATRVERDSLGDVVLPADARWGPQTQRALGNFPISGEPLDAAWVHALGRVKAACARVNASLGVLPPDVAEAIAAAADEVANGEYDSDFPIDVFQTGSGTSSNMNANEVIAGLAAERLGRAVLANDEVNASQSSNDVMPTSLHLAALILLREELRPALETLADSLRRKAGQWADVVKAGRTHLMDAVPVTLGQVFGGYATQIRASVQRLDATVPGLSELAIGGTAVGTGLNAPPGFGALVAAELTRATGLPLSEAGDHFEAQAARDALVSLSGALRGVSVGLHKIAHDIRWMGSGPHTGLAELRLPELAPGSSIMPGKVNPIIPEAVVQVCAQVIGNDAAVGWAAAGGAFELTATIPVIGRNVLSSLRLLSAASRLLAERCVDGLEADEDRCRAYAEASTAVVTGLTRWLGYAETASIAQEALRTGQSVRGIVLARGHVGNATISQSQLDTALDVSGLAGRPE